MEELPSRPKSPAKSPKRPPPPPLAARVRVAVRVRPLASINSGDHESSPLCITKVDSETGTNSSDKLLHFQLEKTQKSFRFDHIFSSEAAQADVYNGALQPLLASLLHGFNVTVLAYGQTGSGKTYTMGGAETSALGSENDDGIIPRLLRDLFEELRNEATVKTTAKISFLEIYCDEIRDLLADGSERARSSMQNGTRQSSTSRLTIHEDDHDVWVEGLQLLNVKNGDEALNLLRTGRQRQTTRAHALNDHSSRSHAVYTLEVSRVFASEIKSAKLTFVDLAGSERVKKTLIEGQGMKEGSHINVGLLALGNVINALGPRQRLLQRRNSTGVSGRRSSISGSDDIAPLGATHVPYRSSKLTRLLRDALGGNSVTLFIACVSPESSNGNETLCTLQYANRTRSIQNKARQNVEEDITEDTVDAEGSLLLGTDSERELYALREQVAALKLQLDQAVTAASRGSALVGVAHDSPNPLTLNPVNPAVSKARKSSRNRRRLGMLPLELDIPDFTNTRERSSRLESGQHKGIVNKSTQQREGFSVDVTTTEQLTLKEASMRAPHLPKTVNPVSPASVLMWSNAEAIACTEKTGALSPSKHTPFSASNIIGDTQTGKQTSQKPLSNNFIRAMLDQSTQYESPSFESEHKTPVDYVLLPPSQIFREVHYQKLQMLAGMPSPWPRRRRLEVQPNEARNCSTNYFALDVNNDELNPNGTPYSKTSDVLQDLLQRTRQLVDDSEEVDNPEEQVEQHSPLSFAAFVDRMTALCETRRYQQHYVRRLMQRFRHLSSLLSATDTDIQIDELSKYTLEHQQCVLQERLETYKHVAAERLWTRLQHREIAIENHAEMWNDKLADVFLSDDQYEACTPWYVHRDDHEFFQHHILPFILNGWISITPEDLENEQLWLSL